MDHNVIDLKNWWHVRGVQLYGVQSIFFNRPEWNMFRSQSDRDSMRSYLDRLFQISELLGCKKVVFGSPVNRNNLNLSCRSAQEIGLHFFSTIGNIAKKYNLDFCIEACPAIYKSNFLTTTFEVLELVDELNHPCVKANLDTGCIITNQEDPFALIIPSPSSFGHIHLSQPKLKTLDSYEDIHKTLGSILGKTNYFAHFILTIETLNSSPADLNLELSTSVSFAKQNYKIGFSTD